ETMAALMMTQNRALMILLSACRKRIMDEFGPSTLLAPAGRWLYWESPKGGLRCAILARCHSAIIDDWRQGTRGRGNKGTRERGSQGTRKPGNKEAREQGNEKIAECGTKVFS